MDKTVVVVGIGYVGLPLAIMLARAGYKVTGVDVKEEIVKAINGKSLHFAEDEIKQIFQEPEVRKNLHAQTTPCKADVFIISVPTPVDERKRVADLAEVISATESIVPYICKGNLIIVESTIPPLTCRNIVAPIIEKSGLKVDKDIYLCHCPERILPGEVFKEIVNNDRIIGGYNPEATEMAREIYASFVKGNLCLTDDVTAELAKLMENTYRDVNIALANEFAAVAEGLNVNPMEVISLANRHPRVHILNPGIGTGGHCIPIDPWFIKEVDPIHSQLINTARMVNEAIPAKIASKIRHAVMDITKPKIVTLGLTYKPNTYDTRNSPAFEVIKLLKRDGYKVASYDPFVDGSQYTSIADISRNADCLVVLVEHQCIKDELASKENEIKQAMRTPYIMRFYQ